MDNNYEISIYYGKLTKNCIAKNFAIIKASFPKLENTYFKILQEMLKDEGFVDERLNDSVKNVIKTCIYPKPSIASFLIYNKNIKLYNYNQYIKIINEYGIKSGNLFKAIKYNNFKRPFWAYINDIEKYKLKLWDEL